MRIIDGRVVLNLRPASLGLFGSGKARAEKLVRAIDAVATAHANITAITVSYGEPPVAVELVVPEDGSLDLRALQLELERLVDGAVMAGE